MRVVCPSNITHIRLIQRSALDIATRTDYERPQSQSSGIRSRQSRRGRASSGATVLDKLDATTSSRGSNCMKLWVFCGSRASIIYNAEQAPLGTETALSRQAQLYMDGMQRKLSIDPSTTSNTRHGKIMSNKKCTSSRGSIELCYPLPKAILVDAQEATSQPR